MTKTFVTKNTFCCSAFKHLFPFYKSPFFLYLFVGIPNKGFKLLWLLPHSFIQRSWAPLGPFCIISQCKGFGHSWIYLFLYLRLFCKRPYFKTILSLFSIIQGELAIHAPNHYLILSYYLRKSLISLLAFPLLK